MKKQSILLYSLWRWLVFYSNGLCYAGQVQLPLYINDHLQYTVRQDPSVFISHVYESLFVEIGNALIDNKPIIIAILYRPNTPPLNYLLSKATFQILPHPYNLNQIKREPWITGNLEICQTKVKLYRQNQIRQQVITSWNVNYSVRLSYELSDKLNFNTIEIIWSKIKIIFFKPGHFWRLLYPMVLKYLNAYWIYPGNVVITHPDKIANAFHTFLANIGHTTSESVLPSQKSFPRYLNLNSRCQKTFFVEPVPPLELINTCNSLKAKTNMGHDNIYTKLLKESI